MLSKKDRTYLKRSINMIINWNKKDCSKNIIHIHGFQDHTIPKRNVNPTYIINEGSHMMIYTKGDEINKIINNEIKKVLMHMQ